MVKKPGYGLQVMGVLAALLMLVSSQLAAQTETKTVIGPRNVYLADGAEFMTTPFLDYRFQAKALERILQMPAAGLSALAVLATRVDNGRHIVEIRDSFSGDFIADYSVLNRLWEVVDLTVIDG